MIKNDKFPPANPGRFPGGVKHEKTNILEVMEKVNDGQLKLTPGDIVICTGASEPAFMLSEEVGSLQTFYPYRIAVIYRLHVIIMSGKDIWAKKTICVTKLGNEFAH